MKGLSYTLVADGEWTDAVAHSAPREVALGHEDQLIDLVLDQAGGIETPAEWHRRGSLVPLNPPR